MVAVTTSLRRDATVAGLVGLAHFSSHFFQLALPPLFPLMKDAFGVSYTALGAIVTVFFTASGVCQAFAGILVDRFGARGILALGISLLAGSIACAGLVPEFWMLYPLAALAGIGNSIFHPADFSIMTSKIDKSRLGRAYSIHAFLGTSGYAASPVVIGGIAAVFNWHIALVAAGLAGIVVALVISRANALIVERHAHAAEGAGRPATISYARLITMPAIMMAFAYFALIAAGGVGLQAFSIAALIEILKPVQAVLSESLGTPVHVASVALTAYLAASACGMLAGGALADKTSRHHVVASIGLFTAGFLMLILAATASSYWPILLLMAAAGFSSGATSPSRDMLIRGATPPGSTGKVFGFVYSGLDLGALLGPLAFGLIIDHAEPRDIFYAVGALFILAITTVLQVRRQTLRAANA
ncbi:MAG: MFS transporter [Alphaproteobacteria bacterium]